jgi:hypothetical protein
MQFSLRYGQITDRAVTLIAQYRLKKGDFNRTSEIENTEAIRGAATARITKPTWRLTKAKRI